MMPFHQETEIKIRGDDDGWRMCEDDYRPTATEQSSVVMSLSYSGDRCTGIVIGQVCVMMFIVMFVRLQHYRKTVAAVVVKLS